MAIGEIYPPYYVCVINNAPYRSTLVKHLESLHLNRLQQPHTSDILFLLLNSGQLIVISDIDDTFQSYSTFTSNYKLPKDYEAFMVAASKIRSRTAKSLQRREASEQSLVCCFRVNVGSVCLTIL